jgi:small basic protein (TIGR04137 family)
MSIDKSLRRKNQLARSRNVLTRTERIKVLQDDERWPEGRSPYGLPKVRVLKVVTKKAKKAKEEEAAAAPEGTAAPAATDKKAAEAKPAAKKGEKK